MWIYRFLDVHYVYVFWSSGCVFVTICESVCTYTCHIEAVNATGGHGEYNGLPVGQNQLLQHCFLIPADM